MKIKLFIQKNIILLLVTGIQLLANCGLNAQTGTWTSLANQPANYNMGVMLLMTDGTVICHNATGGSEGTGWDKLTPDASGSYVNGTWSTIASMHHDRLFFSTEVLPNGNVYAAGGEYGAGDTAAEVYNPVTNTWTVCSGIPSGWNIYDGNSEILYNGTVLEGPQIGAHPSYDCLLYTPSTNKFTSAPSSVYNHDEAEWLKLPDSSVLFVGIASTNSNRYFPKTNTWAADATVPVNLYDTYGEEAGAAFMLPNGKAIFFGATQHNAIYTPSGNTTNGTWVAAPDFPTIGSTPVGMVDAAAAMMVNGHIICAVSPIGTGHNDEFRTPTYFVEYDYVANAFTQVTATIPGFGADSIAGLCSFQTIFLDLPDGNVLFSFNQTNLSQLYWVYTPGSAAIAAGKPTINSIIPGGCPSYKLTGKLFNGITEGAAYGDDWQMASNYPIVRLSNGTNVYYAKTALWNRIGAVQTDSLEDTVTFTPPSNLPAGTYSLVVVANGNASNPVLFTTLEASITSITNVACNGGANGSLTVTGTGGISPYTYSWSPSGGSAATASNLSSHTYTVTVTDANGCNATASASVTQPFTALSESIASHTNITCNGGDNGNATAHAATGGTPPYTYAWSPSGGNSLTASILSANTYTITATDNHGCTATASVAVTQPPPVIVTIASHTNINCNGGTGSANANPATGGISPYTYAWTPSGGNGLSASNLTANSYTITATDNHGCSGSASVNITQPAALGITISTHTNISCNGGNTGSITANAATGGTFPYTYAWIPSGGNGLTASSLTANTYTITVTDNHGCTASASVAITQPASALGVTIASHTNILCNGNNTGSITANAATGGTLPYTYAWTPSGGNGLTASNLTASTYTITTTDNNGCTASASVAVTQPASAIAISIASSTNILCNGGTGSAAANAATGGISPYTYAWTPSGGTGLTASGLTANTYTITATDNNGCSASASASVTQPAPLAANATVVANIGCSNSNSGIVSSAPTGGTTPYTYHWSNSVTNATASNLSAGTYSITVTDLNHCSATASVTITQSSALSMGAGPINNITCYGLTNGRATVTVTGGNPPFTYSWVNASHTVISTSQSTPAILSLGSYTVTVMDSTGCSGTASTSISQPKPVRDSIKSVTGVGCYGGNGGTATAGVKGGTYPYSYVWSPGGSTLVTASGLSAGSYTVTITDMNGCSASTSAPIATITQPTPISESLSGISYPGCNGGKGTATVAVSGGIIPYTYIWTGALSTTATCTKLTAGSYTVTVKDKNSCSTTLAIIMTQPVAIRDTIISSSKVNVSCNGGSNGSATVGVKYGASPYTFAWSPAVSTTATATGLSAGTYSITVTDHNGCSSSVAKVTITQPGLLRDSIKAGYTCTNNLATATLGVKGGTSPYTYAWSPGGGTKATMSGLAPGTYTITVTDKNSCSNTITTAFTCPPSGPDDRNEADYNGSELDNISLYPNPTTGQVTIEIKNYESGITNVEVYNILGQKVYSRSVIRNSQFVIDLSTQPDGIYLIRILDGSGNLLSQKKLVKTE
jgi:hypothetical protein